MTALVSLHELEKRAPREESRQMTDVAALILSGGAGERLFPLTMSCCKPAICIGGKHRLIDVPISNCLHSGCRKIFLLTQFLSSSLHQHIFRTYRFDSFSSGFIEILTAEQRPESKSWFEGTADAVRQNLRYLVEIPAEYFLILSGDQLYKMDFNQLFRTALESDADVVIAASPIERGEVSRMGILKVDEEGLITDFIEKPQCEVEISLLKSNWVPSSLSNGSLDRSWLASMGIYLFKREALFSLLQQQEGHDFGSDLVPLLVQRKQAVAHIHESYWEDIGTIQSFYKANIQLTSASPQFLCGDEEWPLFSEWRNLPGTRIEEAELQNTIVCDGCRIRGCSASRSILGPRTTIEPGCTIEGSYIMGHEYYAPPPFAGHLPKALKIEEGCEIRDAILAEQVHLGANVRLINQEKRKHYNGPGVYIRDGIIIVARGTSLPAGFTL